MLAVKDFFVAHGPFSKDLDDGSGSEWSDNQFQATVERFCLPAGFKSQIVACNAGPPAIVTQNGFVLKAGEVIAELAQAFFNLIGDVEPGLGMEFSTLFEREFLTGGFLIAAGAAGGGLVRWPV